MRHPLVAGEPTSPLARVLVAADPGNGVSAALDYRRFVFINTELTVHLLREPAGRVGLPRRGHATGRAAASAWPRACSPTSAAGSAAPPRRCSSGAERGAAPRTGSRRRRLPERLSTTEAPGATPRHEHPVPRVNDAATHQDARKRTAIPSARSDCAPPTPEIT